MSFAISSMKRDTGVDEGRSEDLGKSVRRFLAAGLHLSSTVIAVDISAGDLLIGVAPASCRWKQMLIGFQPESHHREGDHVGDQPHRGPGGKA